MRPPKSTHQPLAATAAAGSKGTTLLDDEVPLSVDHGVDHAASNLCLPLMSLQHVQPLVCVAQEEEGGGGGAERGADEHGDV